MIPSLVGRIATLFVFLIACQPALVTAALHWDTIDFCKCICFRNSTILPLYLPATPSKPCQSCTKQWCLDQKLDICIDASLGDTDPDTATGKEGDVEARCFQRDSPRDQLVVTLFLLVVFGLLLGAGIKSRMEKTGFDTSEAWINGRRWWEAWLPSRQPDSYQLPLRTSPRTSGRRGAYVGLQAEPGDDT
ncbi:hypothetical protein SISNIDRAFT_549996 [Sistotremastrum niveocremeum HHB9708]|uniref:Transmembrane protein n=2 Tax=Sistotremastraceae TaxID=3402574 RepID=A0A164U6V0_9AGAM|nr:hypothetical protein SISNIDRAFT_549996 [Sistotremastrum niveocremeum HHB9708]KZT44357.1 hypothetical protein SISSUDRAFT_7259 [Sistotremastrum suecicum HHB10207 ss-3]